MRWHVLQISGPLDQEFASALGRGTPTWGWSPVRKNWGFGRAVPEPATLQDPPLELRRFSLQRGYHHWPISAVYGLGSRLISIMQPVPNQDVLVCTTPFYAPVAERWPGPVVYWLTDLMAAYDGIDPATVCRLDHRMGQAATLICPNSRRLAEYLTQQAGCPAGKILVLPNATRASNLYNALPEGPSPLPDDAADLPRPVAGVIGNLASNMNWNLLEELVARSPEFSWLFVGPVDMEIPEQPQATARARLLGQGGSVRFVGGKPYGALQQYARALDVAVLPYQRREPTYSGSSTRFYEHLAACRPMVSTSGFEELLHQKHVLHLADTAEAMSQYLGELRQQGFFDGRERARWQASRGGTWEQRAKTMVDALGEVTGVHAAVCQGRA